VCPISELDNPPDSLKPELEDLRKALDEKIPPKNLDQNILIATWNLRMFGDLTEKWVVTEKDSPKRNLHALRCIVDIVSRFDVIAIQEIRDNLKCLRHMIKALGPNWMFIMTDVTKGSAGNNERLAFIFDTRKVKLSGLACELVLPADKLQSVEPDALKTQFARTPYAVSFYSAGRTFILCTLHVKYGSGSQERVPELKAIAEWLSDWAKELQSWKHDLIPLGDFNIDRKDDDLYKAFTSTGLSVPQDLLSVPRTIFSDPLKPDLNHFYDQIAWFTQKKDIPELTLKFMRGGTFDFVPYAMSSLELTKNQLSYRISDHYPLWAEFDVRP
jgi:endonuclease/exonuclease/phosphatase family metal-dependent hydrolase